MVAQERVRPVENRWSQDQLVAGIELGPWLQILRRHRFDVHSVYFHRAAFVTGLALPATLLGGLERAVYGRAIDEVKLDPTPLFLLGHWRSGTTHLHNLLGRDPAHTYSTVWQAVFPNHFLLSGTLGPKLLRGALPETRTYDAVKQGWYEAAEDEIALIKLSGGLSFYGALMFPDEFDRYERFIDFRDATDAERQGFRDALVLFVKKMMLATGNKRVVVKSCAHSARIPLLLDVAPDAKFVHIHRHPARVFASMMHMRSKVDWENFLQRPTAEFIGLRREHTARLGERLFGRLVEDRHRVPAGNLVELAYDELCGDELGAMRDLYARLSLPTWDTYEPVLKGYLDGLAGYQRNALPLDPELVEFVYDRWRVVYDTYGYPKDPEGYR
jgi:omega-hydroxy-beta-dihydromenaquinone-9 sulfotransferase